MQKKSDTNIPLSPEETYLASQLMGSGMFSAIQLSKELDQIRKRRELAERGDAHVLKIPIPMDKLKTAAADEDSSIIGRAVRFNRHPLRMLVGGQSGFSSAKKEYYKMQREQIAKELQKAQHEYINVLQQIKTGSESSTPNVDAFCCGIVEHTLNEKDAAMTAENTDINDTAVRRLLGDTFHTIKKPFQPALDLGATTLLSSTAGTAYLTYLLRKKMREEPDKYLEEDLPTRVELEPYK